MRERDSLKTAIQMRAAEPAERTRHCPDEAGLAAFAESRIEAALRERIEAHVAGCAYCLGQVAFLVRAQEMETGVPVPARLLARAQELVPERRSFWLVPAWRWAAATAAMAVLVVVVTLNLREPAPLPLTVAPAPTKSQPAAPPRVGAPQTQAPATTPGKPATSAPAPGPRQTRRAAPAAAAPEILSPREGADVARSGLEIRWQPVAGSLYYEVHVVSAQGDLLWQHRVEGTSAQIPREVTLREGEQLFAWVRAHLPDGRTIKGQAIGFRIHM